ncbi:MAG: hypothetical protein CMB09_01390 [Euryarchaeota archaeon]|nr:hypothetical protein [Euryarchaeota archaeon]
MVFSTKNGSDFLADDIDMAERNSREKSNPPSDVIQWLVETGHGVLSTISSNKGTEDYPISSVVPFAITPEGKPYILIAGIAAHTKNLRQNNKSTLFISHPNPEGDPQSFWRASIIGNFKEVKTIASSSDKAEVASGKTIIVTEEEEEMMLIRYRAQVPNADAYLKTHNFSFWLMDHIIKIRYIAGFGRICWIEGDEYLSNEIHPTFQSSKLESIEHMNDDHVDAMIDIYDGYHGKTSSSVIMTDLDSRGVFLQCQDSIHSFYVPFGKTIAEDELRVAIIKLVKQAREQIKAR